MFFYFFEGILLGITVAFIIGPVFFTIIQTSIYRGFKAGVFLSFGVLLSDFTLIILSYIGLLELFSNVSNQFTIGIIGGIILIIFGIVTFSRKPSLKSKDNTQTLKIKKPGPFTYITKGYFMNILNPFLLIFWITVMSVFSAKENISRSQIILFFSGTLTTIFFTDVIKCYVAKKIKRYINELTLLWLNRFVGLILMCFGIALICKVIFISNTNIS